eukprot:7132604-Prymnesium_polylepis.1
MLAFSTKHDIRPQIEIFPASEINAALTKACPARPMRAPPLLRDHLGSTPPRVQPLSPAPRTKKRACVAPDAQVRNNTARYRIVLEF